MDKVYIIAVTPNVGKPFITWADSYKFYPENESLDIFDFRGNKMRTFDFTLRNAKGIKRIDIYDASTPHDERRPLQTILGRYAA